MNAKFGMCTHKLNCCTCTFQQNLKKIFKTTWLNQILHLLGKEIETNLTL